MLVFGIPVTKAPSLITLGRFLISVANVFPQPECELSGTSFVWLRFCYLISKMNGASFGHDALDLQFQ